MFRLHKTYLFLSILLLIIEVLIAAYVNDSIIRPYVGDYLVVILLYCLVRSFLNTPVVPTAIAVLLFSYLVEITQYFRLADMLGVKSRVLRIMMGSYFTWNDIICYTLGIVSVIACEKFKQQSPAL